MNKKTARIVLDIEWEEGHEHDLPSLWNWSLIKYSMDLTNVKYVGILTIKLYDYCKNIRNY